ncbi:MAG: hypothetical protein M3174_03140 [Actinomycetota bacterium]|nr:hypothetical protein [Actinomycetota bacterium]
MSQPLGTTTMVSTQKNEVQKEEIEMQATIARPLEATTTIVVPPRYEGPPGAANGGYISGLVARRIDGPASVRLMAPVPLGRELTLAAHEDGWSLWDGDIELARARPSDRPAEPPDPVGFGPALRASLAADRTWHPFPNCFVCGPLRRMGEGMGLTPGPVEGRDLMATAWVPMPEVVGSRYMVPNELVWATLDCPSAWPVMRAGETAVLGTLTAELHRPVRVKEPLVVASWARGIEGRKLLSGSALYSGFGDVVAVAEATWIKIDG